MMQKIEQIVALNEQIKREVKPFNSSLGLHHAFSFNQTISDSDLIKLTNNNYITLPDEYCLFIKKIGNGGDQPLNGMFKTEQSLAIHSFNNTFAVSYLSDDLFADYWFLEIDESVSRTSVTSDFKCDDSELSGTFDDYYNGERLLNLGGSHFEYNKCILKHALVFSYIPETNLQCIVVLDGGYTGQVMYYNSRIRKIINTHRGFLDWWIAYYEHILNNLPIYDYVSMDVTLEKHE
jgi:hypothetical protein